MNCEESLMSQTPCDGALHRESLELGLVGYADELSVAPGDELKFMVSSAAGDFQADVVRLRHGDSSDAGPGVKYDAVESDVTGVYPGVHQKLRPGSYARIRCVRLSAATAASRSRCGYGRLRQTASRRP